MARRRSFRRRNLKMRRRLGRGYTNIKVGGYHM